MRCMNEVKGNTDFVNMLQQLSHDAVLIKDGAIQHSDTEKVRLYINQTLAASKQTYFIHP